MQKPVECLASHLSRPPWYRMNKAPMIWKKLDIKRFSTVYAILFFKNFQNRSSWYSSKFMAGWCGVSKMKVTLKNAAQLRFRLRFHPRFIYVLITAVFSQFKRQKSGSKIRRCYTLKLPTFSYWKYALVDQMVDLTGESMGGATNAMPSIPQVSAYANSVHRGKLTCGSAKHPSSSFSTYDEGSGSHHCWRPRALPWVVGSKSSSNCTWSIH